MHDVFVSYSSKDKAIADAVVASMEKNGIRCWYAPRDIEPGDDWGGAITNAIDLCHVFLMIFSGNANHSQRVLDELNYAVAQEVIILPFRVEKLEPQGAMMLHLSSRHWLDAYDPSWESHIRKLVQTVSSNLDAALDEEIIELPTHMKKEEKRQRKKRLTLFSILVIIGLVVIAGAWFGLSNLLPGEQNTEETEDLETIQITEDIATQEVTQEITETEELEIAQEAVATEPDDRSTCKIIFYSRRDGDQEVFVMDPDGSDQTQITFNQEVDHFPEFSPDGSQIVFRSMRDGDGEIFVMNSDGTNIRKLTDNESDDINPKWSPDGNWIGYFSNMGGDYDLYIMNADGSNQNKITNQNFPNNLAWPILSWSSDGTMIAFNSDVDGDSEIYLINADGSDITQLTNNETYDGRPDISPDLRYIVFDSDRYGDLEIFIMDIPGDEIRQLTSYDGISSNPRFSPKGTQIVFLSDRDLTSGEVVVEKFEIYVMNSDGSNVIRLTENEFIDSAPSFSPLCDY